MPNWCVTDIEVSGKKNELSKLYDLINTWGQKSLDGDSNEDYCFFRFKDVVELTDIVKYAEIFTDDKLNSLSIRGNLEDMQFQKDDSLMIRISTPYNKSMLLMWVKIFDKCTVFSNLLALKFGFVYFLFFFICSFHLSF